MATKQLRLSQIVAIEKQVKQRQNSEGAEIHKKSAKSDLFNGFHRSYEKKDEAGEDLPGETKIVQEQAADNIDAYSKLWEEMFDTVFTKDMGNTQVFGTVEGFTQAMPVTNLLWLEKQLDDWRTFIAALPVPDSSKAWTQNASTGLLDSEAVKTSRNTKAPLVVVKAPATDKFPAQVELLSQDVLAGYWTVVHTSGGIASTRKKQILTNIDELKKRVKQAREEANSQKVDQYEGIGTQFVQFILNGQ
jgi:hypothetical protein